MRRFSYFLALIALTGACAKLTNITVYHVNQQTFGAAPVNSKPFAFVPCPPLTCALAVMPLVPFLAAMAHSLTRIKTQTIHHQ